MRGKRAAVPGEVFGRRPSALDKLTGVAPDNGSAVAPSYGDTASPSSGATPGLSDGGTVEPSDRATVPPPHRETGLPPGGSREETPREAGGEGLKKTSFYLRADQLDKLDELAYAYKRRTGRRIDRQDIVRALIDRCTLDDLLGGCV